MTGAQAVFSTAQAEFSTAQAEFSTIAICLRAHPR
jgi:hypothetical protein